MRKEEGPADPVISVICPWTDDRVRKELLEASLDRQTFRDFELIPLNNRELGMDRASAVLNEGVRRARGEMLVFAHQDVELLDPDFLGRLWEYGRAYDFGIGGVAGPVDGMETVWASVVQGEKREQVGVKLEVPREADSCDECLFFIKKKGFMGFADLGATWHFYAVEYSLHCRTEGKKVMLFPLPVYHASPGWSIDEGYWRTLDRVAERYRGRVKAIPTTLGVFTLDGLYPLKRIKRIWTARWAAFRGKSQIR